MIGAEINVRPLAPVPDDLPPRPWLVPGLLMRKQITLLSAQGGLGKSMLSLQLAVMCANGMKWCGWQPIAPLRVLYVGSEDDLTEMQRRLCGACGVMKMPQPVNLFQTNATVLVAYDPENGIGATAAFGSLQAKIVAENYDFVILDPLIEMQGGLNENDNNQMDFLAKRIRELARMTNTAVLLIHHHRKNSVGGSQDSARGAGSLLAAVRFALTLTEDENGSRKLQGAKANYAAKHDAMNLQMQSVRLLNGDGVGVFVEPVDVNVIDDQRVLDYVRERHDGGNPLFASPNAKKDKRLSCWLAVQFGVNEHEARDYVDGLMDLGVLIEGEVKLANGKVTRPLMPAEGQDVIPF